MRMNKNLTKKKEALGTNNKEVAKLHKERRVKHLFWIILEETLLNWLKVAHSIQLLVVRQRLNELARF
jgi:hypothetical protein